MNVVPLCQVRASSASGVACVDVLIAYSTFWSPGFVGTVTGFTEMLFDVAVLATGTLLTAAPGAMFTVKLTLKLSEIPLLPLTVTVALYVSTASPCFGLTVKLRVASEAMLASVPVAGDTISNAFAFGPVRDMFNAPVACLAVPTFRTVTEAADLAP